MPRSKIARFAAFAFLAAASGFVIAAFAPNTIRADEGMWTLDNPPSKILQERYGFAPTKEWLERIQHGCVNFGGGSGSFVSPNGLVLTNHHVALNQLQKMSTAEHNYVRDGFFAKTGSEEMPCPDLELKVLQSMDEVTKQVLAAVDPRATIAVQSSQRKAAMARLETEASQSTGLKCEVIELYHGAEYWLYRYKKYNDVRLVMAPEEQIAFYGGDPDNFSYPRHDLDMAFFRVYENGRPVHPDSWFRLSDAGPSENELVFVAGHPGATSRLKTVSQLEYERDCLRPTRITQQESRLKAIRAYAAESPENTRRAVDRDRGIENNLKRERAFLEILKDGPLLAQKRDAESALRARVAKDPKIAADCSGSWDKIASAEKELRGRYKQRLYRDLDRSARLVNLAENIVRYTAEVQKPNEKRFREYRDSNLPTMKFQIYSKAPVFPDLDAVILANSLEQARATLGPNDPWVKQALGGKEPMDVAKSLTQGTRIGDPTVRKQLMEGGAEAIAASADPMIVWVRGLDPIYRELRTWYEDHVETVESLEGGRIARARFALDGHSTYPDATGSLRLSPGKVAGYKQLTTDVPWKTTWFGLFDRSTSFDGRHPYDIPARVAAARGKLDLAGPLNFVCTTDIIGGNSGSPVLGKDLSLVGLIFDGNVQAFGWEFAYDDAQGRAVAVSSAAILQSLRKIYDMNNLADELQSGRTASVPATSADASGSAH
ncbi:MAG TPA: S46 family peptidase [Candidatus Sulfotelmatobacter sp.]|nr:S46 family peptidase [Candidatus Sulfotelmatobacter sp.]